MHRNDRLIVMLGIIVVIVALIGAAVGGRPEIDVLSEEKEIPIKNWPIKEGPVKHISGYLNENSDETRSIFLNYSYITEVTIKLNWLDEAPATGPGRYENQPDSFNFTVTTPWGGFISSDVVYNTVGQAGLIEERILVPEEGIETSDAEGEWIINIYCLECGENEPTISFTNARDIADNGNAWALEYLFKFHEKTV
jgi:hypothetical protein